MIPDDRVEISVSVPFRGISFLNGSTRNASWLILFPSPSGVSHFSIYTIQLTKKDYHFVSVPFRGISFLNSILLRSFIRMIGTCFRPLPGYLISQFRPRLRPRLPQGRVSVPFRGISFLNLTRAIFEKRAQVKVSVPFRGISFLNGD